MQQPISLSTTNQHFLVKIDRKLIDKEKLMDILELLRLELLAKAVDFDASIEDLGEEIKKDWWEKNKDWFLNKER